jgi:hypothetical protein
MNTERDFFVVVALFLIFTHQCATRLPKKTWEKKVMLSVAMIASSLILKNSMLLNLAHGAISISFLVLFFSKRLLVLTYTFINAVAIIYSWKYFGGCAFTQLAKRLGTPDVLDSGIAHLLAELLYPYAFIQLVRAYHKWTQGAFHFRHHWSLNNLQDTKSS